ncbi:prenyltransferase/squalene oxidase repeat-containing protein [Amycolatopsis sp. QT-25]|uniref:prenyltransferase/squalene oxidase repeat-containing protein n=1 Tax=Amycolatopsis sp. QT-25 TaxID=3034022 RepID=UPI0023EB4876|nr:prenyltransferase/squalene oxidase repeat-containing protein [Amycolatopsis sp. QT-25]WET77272.1 prenyltransferase/squalene oxidase repeat-containing protein [Amycolatopsis sp. QT-25]
MRRLVFAVAMLCGIGLLAAPAATAATRNKADAAAGWLARQMVDGERFEADFGGQKFPDQGLTIDAIFAFAAAGVSDTNAGKAIAWLAKPEITAGYVGSGSEAYAGAHAKLLLAAQIRGKDPASFGGVDLKAGLLSLLTPSGRFSDRSEYGDYSNTLTQSLALLALDRAPGGAPAPAAAFLAGSQCPDGGFPQNFGEATCTSDVDATATVVQALRATGDAVNAHEGTAWLVTAQHANGGFGFGTNAPNANSTGLAAEALAGHRPAAAVKAREFLRSLHTGCAGAEADRGAIAYDATGLNPATAPRATAQAILGLTRVPLSDLHGGGRPQAPVLACP